MTRPIRIEISAGELIDRIGILQMRLCLKMLRAAMRRG